MNSTKLEQALWNLIYTSTTKLGTFILAALEAVATVAVKSSEQRNDPLLEMMHIPPSHRRYLSPDSGKAQVHVG
jgi:hypothetical protein